MRSYILTFCMVLFVACGQNPSNQEQMKKSKALNNTAEQTMHSSDNEQNHDPYAQTLLLQSADNLPLCTPELTGQLAYIVKTERLITCDSGTWVDLSIGSYAIDETIMGDY